MLCDGWSLSVKRLGMAAMIAGMLAASAASPAWGIAVQPPPAPNKVGEMRVTTFPPYTALVLPMKGSFNQHDMAIKKLLACASEKKLKACGLFAIYYNSPQEVPVDSLKWDICMEVPEGTQIEAPFLVRLVPETLAAYVICIGGYDNTHTCYPPLNDWISHSGYKPVGAPEEHWLSDSERTRVTELQTRIMIPVAPAQ
jgi:AraC family transcriptional regulator